METIMMTQANDTLKTRVDALCRKNNSNLRKVCIELDIPYKSCRTALTENRDQYRNLHKIATFLSCSIEWIRNGKISDLDDNWNNKRERGTRYDGFINRDLINVDDQLSAALDLLDNEKDLEKRMAITLLISYMRELTVTYANTLEQYIDVEDVLIKTDAVYSATSFKRAKDTLQQLRDNILHKKFTQPS